MLCGCCFPKKKRRTKVARRKRRVLIGKPGNASAKSLAAATATSRGHAETLILPNISRASERTLSAEERFYDCHEDLASEASSEGNSPVGTQPSPRVHIHDDALHHDTLQITCRANGNMRSHASEHYTDASSGEYDFEDEDEEEDEEEEDGLSGLGACLGIMDTKPHHSTKRADILRHLGREHLLPAGISLRRRDPSEPMDTAYECWDECEAATFSVRGLDYMRSKAKVPSGKPLYHLVAMDMFSFPNRSNHIAKHMALPAAPSVTSNPLGFPLLLVVNLQLPTYQPPFFGTPDGPGHSMVFYYALRDDTDPAAADNPAALYLLQRFFDNGREADGTPTRERLKLIPKVTNCDEWAARAPLSGAEAKLLKSYNEKPVLTRPQQAFFTGPDYFEVDLDVHSYAFLARKALVSFMARIKEAVWDVGLVVQGNAPEELPEQVVACGRVVRVDFERQRPFESFLQTAGGTVGEAGEGADGAAA